MNEETVSEKSKNIKKFKITNLMEISYKGDLLKLIEYIKKNKEIDKIDLYNSLIMCGNGKKHFLLKDEALYESIEYLLRKKLDIANNDFDNRYFN